MEQKKTFEEIAEEIVKLHAEKNTAYGNAFNESFAKYEQIRPGAGLEYAIGRMGDKMQRLTNLAFHPTISSGDEPIVDNAKDLAAYAIMLVEVYDEYARTGYRKR